MHLCSSTTGLAGIAAQFKAAIVNVDSVHCVDADRDIDCFAMLISAISKVDEDRWGRQSGNHGDLHLSLSGDYTPPPVPPHL